MSALALIKQLWKFTMHNPNIFQLVHLTILNKLYSVPSAFVNSFHAVAAKTVDFFFFGWLGFFSLSIYFLLKLETDSGIYFSVSFFM